MSSRIKLVSKDIAESKPPAQRRRRQPEQVKARILEAAQSAFAQQGFDGASVRSIAEDAHVSFSLTLYHFQSKDILWKAVMEESFRRLSIDQTLLDAETHHLSASDTLRELLRFIVTRFAQMTAFHQMMSQEAHRISDRLLWLHENFLKADFQRISRLIVEAQKEGKVRKMDAGRLRFAIIALGSIPFSMSAEYQLLTGRNAFSPEEIEATLDLLNRLIFLDG